MTESLRKSLTSLLGDQREAPEAPGVCADLTFFLLPGSTSVRPRVGWTVWRSSSPTEQTSLFQRVLVGGLKPQGRWVLVIIHNRVLTV